MACAIVAMAALAASLAAAGRDKFGVGVMRRDGLIIPFATYDGSWGSSWPLPEFNLTIPISLSGIPKRWWGPTPPLEDWQISTAAGTRSAHVVQPDWVQVHCVRQVALKTDYRKGEPSPPPAAQPYPKDGLAVSPAYPVERIDVVPPSAPEVRALVPELLKAFNAAERKVEDRSGHPLNRRAREGVEPTIEATYAYGTNPRAYYVEAARGYREIGRDASECAGIAFGTGWFVTDGTTVRTLAMATDLLDCRRTTASYMLPLGVIRRTDHIYWLAQFSGWNQERYVVLEIKSKKVDVLVNVWGGSC
jgi:hypothetical protein